MGITLVGKTNLSPDELAVIGMNRNSLQFKSKIVTLSDNAYTQVYRYGRIVIKYNKPKYVKREVEYCMKLSALSPVFLPILAYGDDFFVIPYVEGIVLANVDKNPEVIKQMSCIIANLLIQAGIIYEDLHDKNVIITPVGFHVIDLEQFRPMSDWFAAPPSLRDIADEVFGQLMYGRG